MTETSPTELAATSRCLEKEGVDLSGRQRQCGHGRERGQVPSQAHLRNARPELRLGVLPDADRACAAANVGGRGPEPRHQDHNPVLHHGTDADSEVALYCANKQRRSYGSRP